MKDQLPPEFLAFLAQIRGKRARIVIDHILEHGMITTADLLNYGYKHAPRAIRDVRDQGVPIITTRITDSDGKSIAAYTFGDPSDVQSTRLGGRRQISKVMRQTLYAHYDGHCAICGEAYPAPFLQADHRVPYAIMGDIPDPTPADYLLLCRECNRAKAWTCEHCPNFVTRDPIACLSCYWATPAAYQHIATRPLRRVELVWTEDDAALFDALVYKADVAGVPLHTYLKALLAGALGNEDE